MAKSINNPFRKIGTAGIQAASLAGAAQQFLRPRGRRPASTQFSVETFKAKLNELGGPARTNRFFVQIATPPWALQRNKNLTGAPEGSLEMPDLMFVADSTTVPSLSYALSETRRHGVGPLGFYPTTALYNEHTVTFLGDNQGRVLKFFNDWFHHITYRASLNETGTSQVHKGAMPHEVFYKKEYATTMEIVLFNQEVENPENRPEGTSTNSKLAVYQFERIFPVAISPIALSWGSDDLMKIEVIFRYDSWSTEDLDFGEAMEAGRGLSGLQKLLKSATLLQTASAIRQPQHVGDLINIANNAKLITDNFNF